MIPPMDYGLSTYSFPFSCGFMRDELGRAPSTSMTAFGLAELAQTFGLASIETPLDRMVPDLSDAGIDRFRNTLELANLGLVVDTGVINIDSLRTVLPQAKRAGAGIVRAMLSTVLEGARAQVPGGWAAYQAEMIRRLQ